MYAMYVSRGLCGCAVFMCCMPWQVYVVCVCDVCRQSVGVAYTLRDVCQQSCGCSVCMRCTWAE